MNKVKNKRNSLIVKIFALAIILAPIFLLLFAYKYLSPISKTLTVDVLNIKWGTSNSQNYVSLKIYVHRIQIGNNSTKYRTVKIDTSNFSLVDKLGNTVGKLDQSKTTVPFPPNSYTIGVDGQTFIGDLNFVDIGKDFDEGFLVFKDESSRYLKIPIELKLPVTY